MVRCVADDDGLRLDPHGPGRGAWVCNGECMVRAGRRGGFERSMRRRVPTGDIEALAATIGWDGASEPTG
jgi:predicted RNA-binding protein YlxR (DUF448 family)